jgi:Uma2 family endonuclease
MRTEVEKRLFTVDEFYRMADAGIFGEDDRVELIEGEILQMSAINQRHFSCVNRTNDVFTSAFKGRAIVSIQNPLRLNNYNEPMPDIVLLKPRADYYASERHTPADTFLVVEVSDTTIRYDQKIKLPLYAAAGIGELWIENLQEDLLLVCRDAVGKDYETKLTFRRGESVSPIAFPEVVFKVEDLLG